MPRQAINSSSLADLKGYQNSRWYSDSRRRDDVHNWVKVKQSGGQTVHRKTKKKLEKRSGAAMFPTVLKATSVPDFGEAFLP